MMTKLEELREVVDGRTDPAGLFAAGIAAALRALARRSPELAESEAEEWREALHSGPTSLPKHRSLDGR